MSALAWLRRPRRPSSASDDSTTRTFAPRRTEASRVRSVLGVPRAALPGLLALLLAAAWASGAQAQTPNVFWRSTTAPNIAESIGVYKATLEPTKALASNLVVSYTVGGTATLGTDYTIADCTASPCTFTMPSGSPAFQSVDFPITIISDSVADSGETIVLTLQSGTDYGLGSPSTITITLFDDTGTATYAVTGSARVGEPLAVTRTASDPDGDGTATGYQWGWTDSPSATSGTTIFGETSSTFSPREVDLGRYIRVRVFYTDGVGFPHGVHSEWYGPVLPAFCTADPVISITGGPAVTEGGDATFTLNSSCLPAKDLSVRVRVWDPQTDGFIDPDWIDTFYGENKYGTVTISMGEDSATLRVRTQDDRFDEIDGRVTAQVFAWTNGTYRTPLSGDVADVEVKDNDEDDGTTTPPPPAQPVITIARDAASVTEGTAAEFTLTANPAPTASLTVSLDVTQSGDFAASGATGGKTVTFAADSGLASYNVGTVNDSTDEANGSVTVTVNSGADYSVGSPGAATVTVNDDDNPPPGTPVAQFAAGASSAAEDAGTRNVAIRLTSAPPSAITLTYTVNAGGGTAVEGTDFSIANSGSVSVSTGATEVVIPVSIIDDLDAEGRETVVLRLTGGGTAYSVGTPGVHTLTIPANDGYVPPPPPPPPGVPAVTFAQSASRAGEGSGVHEVTLAITPAPGSAMLIGYTVTGTATEGDDFTIPNPGSVLVPAGNGSVTIPVTLLDDTEPDPEETVILTLTSGTGYEVGSPQVHTLTITDNEKDGGGDEGGDGGESGDPTPGTPVAAFAADTSRPSEDAGTSDVTVALNPVPTAPLTLTYTVGGTARNGHDYTLPPTRTLAVAANQETITLPVALLDDHVAEEPETLILTLTAGEGYTVGSTQVHTLTITDNDTAGVTVSPTTVHLAEAGETVSVSVHLTSQPMAPVTVTLTSAQPGVATLVPASLRFTSETWQTPQPVTITAGADGLTTLTIAVQSQDATYTSTALPALPRLRVRVGADLTALTSPWLARFGRTVTGQAITGMTARLSASRTPGLTGTVAGLALDRLGEAPATDPARPAPSGEPQDPRVTPGGRLLNVRDLLANSAFALTSTPSAAGGSYALWGQGAWTRFAGQEGAQNLDGDVLSGTLGVDWAQGPWVLGVAVSHTQGEGNAVETQDRGALESSLTLVTPYVGVDVTEQVTLWGTLGYGRGTVSLTLPTEPEVETDTSLLLAAAGLRGQLREPAAAQGLAVAVRAEARFLRTTAEAAAARGLAESEADVGLLRLGLEGAWHQPLADGGSVVPRLDLGLRQDAGDAETGVGLEVRGGVRWEAPAQGLTLDLAGQTLLAHHDREFETWGGSATVQWDPDPVSAAGPTLTLRQTYGVAGDGGANTFWTEDPVALLPTPGPADLRLTAEFGWGVPLQAGLGVPHVAYGWAPTSRELALGWRLLPTRATDVTLDLTATHREAARTAPVQGVALSLTRTW